MCGGRGGRRGPRGRSQDQRGHRRHRPPRPLLTEGIGKPEPLRQNLSGHWTRRITGEHRLVFLIDHETVVVFACRFRYE
ncbi:Txe/YoeB family addiction module toxin [Nocardia flavorosea]|uniref:Endoribonuclease YoeB n=1 Tax=Nocardia flavorosea TaxID=53429 RepID=A0A846YGL4_9NOCA|nr:Txe/YoeB family addiction module toxin [Nocardia flavorosea]NKY56870.1 Txe/YoeB family addiction module toxin [Nocardia flavorosea]